MTQDYPRNRDIPIHAAGGSGVGSGSTFDSGRTLPAGFSGLDGVPRYFIGQRVQHRNSPAVNNSVAYQSLTDLTFQIQPGTSLDVEMMLLYTCSATSDFNWKWSADTSSGLDIIWYYGYIDATTGLAGFGYSNSAANTVSSNGAGTNQQVTWARGIIRNRGTFLITITPQFTQNIAEASDTIVLAGSFLRFGNLGTLQ